jgi:hypothetical protein
MGTPDLLQGRDALTLLYSLEAQEIEALAWEDVPACTGVQQKVLWRLGGFSGTVTIAGRRLAAGSYMHVPPGVGHEATAGDAGCTLLQMHRPHPPTEADLLDGLS